MENTNPQTVADQAVDMMAKAGIKHIYAITGDSLNPLTDAIGRDGRIKFIHMRHEESGAFAASAEAQLTGRLACCAGSSGPGHVHLINGLYDAQRSDAPVLAIASTCASNFFGTGYFQETDPTLLFSNCSVYNHTANTATQAPVMLQAAMQEAISKGGVGVIGLPADVVGAKAVTPVSSTEPLVTEQLPEASEEEIANCAQIVNEAKNVAIFAGIGCAGALDELNALADQLKAPVSTTFKSQVALLKNLPNYVGHMGYLGMWSAEKAISDADVVLMIGTHFPFPGFFPTGKKTIQVDIRAARLGRVADLEMGIRSDAGKFIRALLPKLTKRTDSSYLDQAMSDFAEIQKEMRKPVADKGAKGAIRPEYMFSLLNDLADDNAVFTIDTGMNCVWAAHYLEAKKDRRMVGSLMHGSMANAMPMSIGAYMAMPDRQIISCSGDGGFAMLMGDLLTIIQYQLPVKILVADNRSLAYVQWEMALAGFKPSEVALTNPDFGKMGEAIGFQAWTVDDPAQLESTMKEWLSAKGPAILSVMTETEAASFTFSKEMMQGAKPTSPIENFMVPGSI